MKRELVKLAEVDMEKQVTMLEEDLGNFQERGSDLQEVMSSTGMGRAGQGGAKIA